MSIYGGIINILRTASNSSYVNLEVVQYVMEKCCANLRGRDGDIVQGVCAHEHLDVIQYLLEKCGSNFGTALGMESTNVHAQIVEYLVE